MLGILVPPRRDTKPKCLRKFVLWVLGLSLEVYKLRGGYVKSVMAFATYLPQELPAISLSKSLLERYGNIKSIRDSKEQISEALLFFALMRMPFVRRAEM